MKHVVISAFLTLFLIAGLVLTGWVIRAYLRSADSETWPVTKGRVILTDILFSSGTPSAGRRSTVFYTPYVRYEYSYQGKAYTADVISFVPEGHSDRAIAAAFLKDYPMGGEVSVHVNPNDPAMAVLLPGQDTTMMMALFFALTFVAISILSLAGYNLYFMKSRS